MKIGLIGLGKMGGAMAARLRGDGHEVVGFDHDPDVSDVADLAALVAALEPPRVIWVMVPAGAPTESTIDELASLIEAGDLIVDGANGNWADAQRRAEMLAQRSIGFVDAGVSGGVWGLENGFCLMVGGSDQDVGRVQPILNSLGPTDGVAHVGPAGCGHYTKMVHNAVEYGMMQSYAEGYELLEAGPEGLNTHDGIEVWRHGSVVRSWLLELLVNAMDEDPGFESIAGYANDSGHGRWAVQEAIDRAVPVPVMSAALFARFTSRQLDSPSMKVIAALRNQFGGHAVIAADDNDDDDQ